MSFLAPNRTFGKLLRLVGPNREPDEPGVAHDPNDALLTEGLEPTLEVGFFCLGVRDGFSAARTNPMAGASVNRLILLLL